MAILCFVFNKFNAFSALVNTSFNDSIALRTIAIPNNVFLNKKIEKDDILLNSVCSSSKNAMAIEMKYQLRFFHRDLH